MLVEKLFIRRKVKVSGFSISNIQYMKRTTKKNSLLLAISIESLDRVIWKFRALACFSIIKTFELHLFADSILTVSQLSSMFLALVILVYTYVGKIQSYFYNFLFSSLLTGVEAMSLSRYRINAIANIK